ncbi:MAG: tetratricopeptide repeat protein, partial [Patescibacteria group bacterium]|nr:tetratricopeptide repeat protein [Patescibacteria group bacterium]
MENDKRYKPLNLREKEGFKKNNGDVIPVRKKEESFFQKQESSGSASPVSDLKAKFLNKVKQSNQNKISGIFDKAISSLLYLLIFLLPIFVLPFSMEIYEFNKTILLFVLSSSVFLIWITKMVLIDKKLTFIKTSLDIPIIVFISLILISTIFSVDKISSVLGFYGRFSDSLMVYLSLAMIYFVVVNYTYQRRHIDILPSDTINNLIKTFLASSFIVVIAGLLYSFSFKFIPWSETQFRSFNLVAGSANILGIYLIAVILIALGCRQSRDALNRVSTNALIVMSLILLALIDLVLAWIILAISLVVVLALIFITQRKTSSAVIPKSPVVASIIVILISLIFTVSSLTSINKDVDSNFLSSSISTSIKSRLLSADDDQVANSDKFTREIILDKETAVAVAIGGIKDDPIAGAIGSGPGTYLYNFSKFKPVEFNNNAFWNIRFDKAGSEIIEKISTIGILGVLSYLIIIILAMGMFLKNLFRSQYVGMSSSDASPFQKGGGGDFGGIYLFSAWFALFLFQFFYLEATTTKFLFWLFTAILVAECYRNSDSFVLDLKKEKSAFYSSLIVLVALLVSFFASNYYQFKFYQAEAAYKDISVKQDRELEGVSLDNQKIGELLSQRADDLENKVIKKNPYRGEYKSYLSDIYLRKASFAFQEENSKNENEQDTQKIAIEVKNTIDYLKDATDSSPKNIIFQHKLGATYSIMARDFGVTGADSWAIKKYNRAIELEPTNPILYTELGKVLILSDQVDLAITEFKKALSLKKNYVEAGLQLGLAYEKQGDNQKAIDLFNSLGSVKRIESVIAAGQIVTSQSIDVDIAFQLGRIYYNTNEINMAKDIFLKIIKINPSHSNAHYSLGLIYKSKGDKDKALEEFEAVLSLNPENEDVKSKINELKGIDDSNKNEETRKPEIEPE